MLNKLALTFQVYTDKSSKKKEKKKAGMSYTTWNVNENLFLKHDLFSCKSPFKFQEEKFY